MIQRKRPLICIRIQHLNLESLHSHKSKWFYLNLYIAWFVHRLKRNVYRIISSNLHNRIEFGSTLIYPWRITKWTNWSNNNATDQKYCVSSSTILPIQYHRGHLQPIDVYATKIENTEHVKRREIEKKKQHKCKDHAIVWRAII